MMNRFLSRLINKSHNDVQFSGQGLYIPEDYKPRRFTYPQIRIWQQLFGRNPQSAVLESLAIEYLKLVHNSGLHSHIEAKDPVILYEPLDLTSNYRFPRISAVADNGAVVDVAVYSIPDADIHEGVAQWQWLLDFSTAPVYMAHLAGTFDNNSGTPGVSAYGGSESINITRQLPNRYSHIVTASATASLQIDPVGTSILFNRVSKGFRVLTLTVQQRLSRTIADRIQVAASMLTDLELRDMFSSDVLRHIWYHSDDGPAKYAAFLVAFSEWGD